jgi:small-conductance mechanosensitive channel
MPCTFHTWKGSVAAKLDAVPPAGGSADADPGDVTNRMRPAPSTVLASKRQLASVVVLLLTLGCPFGLKGQVTVDSAPAVLRYLNRPITVFRASILSRSPAERAAVASANLDRFIEEGASRDVSTHESENVVVVSVSGRPLLVLVPQDLDSLRGETLDGKVSETVANLRRVLGEAAELRATPRMLRNAGELLLGIVVVTVLLLAAGRFHRRLVMRLPMLAERELAKLSSGNVLVEGSRATHVFAGAIHVAYALAAVAVVFSWVTFSLRRFPYTRPLGESLRAFLLSRAAAFGGRFLDALPDLFMVLAIVLVTRFFVRLSNHVFAALEQRRIDIPGFHPETAHATQRLAALGLWLLGILVAYPYVPGSNSDVFKGLSVFIGLVVSLGSRGIVDQMMSGLLLTYSRAIRTGDFVKLANIEGTVVQTAALSTKIKTPRGEEVTIPNAVVVAGVTLNYTRFADADGVYVPTVVSIGYDVPWRKVRALLLLAAARTPGVCERPEPLVRQSALGDFSVQHTLLVCLSRPQLRGATLSALHENILDAFNDAGVQIMSPHYEGDPLQPKLVPREQSHVSSAGDDML